jgi:protein-L-isoaspartate(D-aspartate) O-methyltransferase
MNDGMTSASPEALRLAMVDHILAGGTARSERVADAMRAVPRHRFVPAASIEDAYAHQAVITKRGSDGAALSCASLPRVVALMLDQLDVRPGDRILEIGAGTGYNAALLADLAGPAGHVTTIDIDTEVTAETRRALDATGYGHVNVVTRDGALGDTEHAPYDRIILTVGAWDIPRAWWEQLVPGGHLVLPLRWRGQTRSVAFVREDGRLRSDSVELCGFVPMVGQEGECTGHIDSAGQVALFWDADQPIDPAALRGALDQPRTEVWSTVSVGAEEPFDGVWLLLTAMEPRTCRIAAERTAVDTGLCTPAIPARSPALVDDDSLAYFAVRRTDGVGANRRSELGAIGHGPSGRDLAGRLCEAIGAWDLDRTARPIVTAHLAETRGERAADERSIRKPHIRLVVTY